MDKGEPFQIKGFTKGENAEFFGKIKGFSPVNHFGFTLICQARCKPNMTSIVDDPWTKLLDKMPMPLMTNCITIFLTILGAKEP